METVGTYGWAMAGLTTLAAIALIQAVMAVVAKSRAGMPPGAMPPADFSNRAFRLDRAHMNSLETLTPVAVIVFAAMFVGVGARLLAAYVWIGVVARIVAWVFHVREGQKEIQGPRSMAYVVIWLTTMFMAGNVILRGVIG